MLVPEPTSLNRTPDSVVQCIAETQQYAEKAVKILQLGDFIRDNRGAICCQLEQIDKRITEASGGTTLGLNRDADFIAQSLPLINGVINVGSSRRNMDAAIAWVKTQSPDADPIPLLSSLALIYIVAEAWKDMNQEAQKSAASKPAGTPITMISQKPGEPSSKELVMSSAARDSQLATLQQRKGRWDDIYRRIHWLCDQ